MSSSSAAFEDATNETRSSSSAVESADGESAIAEEVESGAGRNGTAENDIDEHQEADAEVQGRDAKGHRRQKERRLIAKRKKAYLDLLGETAKESAGAAAYGSEQSPPLSKSRIGASVWTRYEKECFFSSLARYGKGNLSRVAKTVGTKSETEVRHYLLALEAGLDHHLEDEGGRKFISLADVPAAHEIGDECEKALDVAAEAAIGHDKERHARAEQDAYADAWLIDADTAATIDQLLYDSQDDEGDEDANEGRASAMNLLSPSATFFDTALLLQLSRNVFMNGPPDDHWNYRTADLITSPKSNSEVGPNDDSASNADTVSPSEPAIYQSALSELHQIVKTVAQKLVHATLFQATSRLRAKDNDSPASVVLASDVHVAMDVLGFNLDWKTYWAKLPRRVGLEVYSESEKYKTGRTGTKDGVKLTYDEVEAELGLSEPLERSARGHRSLPDRLNSYKESGEDTQSEIFSSVNDSDISSDGIVEVTLEKENRKRRRALSPDSFALEEEKYMRALDTRADRAEDDRLRELLGLEMAGAVHVDEEDMPSRPKLKKKFQRREEVDWRDDAEPIAAWEVEYVERLRVTQGASDSDGVWDDNDSSGDSDSGAGDRSGRDTNGPEGVEVQTLSLNDEMASNS